MILTHIMGARLETPQGTVTLERLGKGTIHTVYLDRETQMVYVVTVDGATYPKGEYLGDLDGTQRRVYRMPFDPKRARAG